MDLISILIYLGIPSAIFGIILQAVYSRLKNKTSYIQRVWAWVMNKSYKIRLIGVKKYDVEKIDINHINKKLFKRFNHVSIESKKKNSIIFLIDDMQAPYKMLVTNEEGETIENIKTIIQIDLIGNVEFRYRESDENDKFFYVLGELFDLVEDIINEKPVYSLFKLQADFKNEFKKRPFMTNVNKDDCENTKLYYDKSSNYMEINSRTKDNLYKCLKKNIHKIL